MDLHGFLKIKQEAASHCITESLRFGPNIFSSFPPNRDYFRNV